MKQALFLSLALFSISAAYSPVPLEAQAWEAIPLVNQEALAAGSKGGEGGQAIRTLVISPSDPRFLLMGTDVGGIYRSLDAGGHWQICMSGWNARGGNAFAIDPKNPDRVLGVGANGNDFGPASMGVYLSTDRGASWRQVLPRNDGNEWRRDSVAFDPATFDAKAGACTVAYFESRDGGLFKSTDAGTTWSCVNKERSGAAMKIHPTRGFVYLADNSRNGHGFHKSSDGGKTFRQVNGNYTLGLDVIAARPDNVYLARWDKVLKSEDAGETFKPVGRNEGLKDNTPIQDVRVSPADPKFMACKHGGPQWWESYVYYSDDGGDTWHKPVYDNSLAFLPFTQPDEKCVFHPADAKTVFSTAGGGWVVKSGDGGKTYAWHNEGQNAVMLGASFNFSAAHPDCVFLAFQDFAGAATLDGGKTWTFRNASGNGWGGFDYGGYTPDGKTLWCGDAPGWTGPRTLKLSRDGGQTWDVMKDPAVKPVVFGGADVSSSDPGNAEVYFASNYRSPDAGRTWSAMRDCDGVFTASPDGKELFGRRGGAVCKSIDHGQSWADVTKPVVGGIRDVAVDPPRGRTYVASEDRVKVFEQDEWTTLQTPKDQYQQVHVYSVAIDPRDPAIVYAGGPANLYASDATIVRSTDAGRTWVNLTRNDPLKAFPAGPGPREVQWVRVHPKTREAWVNGECYGMWKLSPPRAGAGDDTAAPVSQPAARAGDSNKPPGTEADQTELLKSGDFSAWRLPTGAWAMAGDVLLDPADPRKLKWSDAAGPAHPSGHPPTGDLVNGPAGRTSNLLTREEFGDVQAHVEFMISRSSNSGVYFMGRYELQIYDSFGVEKDQYPGIECGGIYPRWIDNRNVDGHSPTVNTSLPPGKWQTFDVTFRAPRFDAAGHKTADAVFVKVVHNGKTIHENVRVKGPTRSGAFDDERPTGPLLLQGDHGPVAFRNVRLGKPANSKTE